MAAFAVVMPRVGFNKAIEEDGMSVYNVEMTTNQANELFHQNATPKILQHASHGQSFPCV